MVLVTVDNILNMENLFINEIFGSATFFFLAAYIFIFWFAMKRNMSPVIALYLAITFTGLFALWYAEVWWLIVSVVALLMTMAWKRFLGRD